MNYHLMKKIFYIFRFEISILSYILIKKKNLFSQGDKYNLNNYDHPGFLKSEDSDIKTNRQLFLFVIDS